MDLQLKQQMGSFKEQVREASELASKLNQLLDRLRNQTGTGAVVTGGVGKGVVIVPVVLAPAAVYIVWLDGKVT